MKAKRASIGQIHFDQAIPISGAAVTRKRMNEPIPRPITRLALAHRNLMRLSQGLLIRALRAGLGHKQPPRFVIGAAGLASIADATAQDR
jgi:hypothetical protein